MPANRDPRLERAAAALAAGHHTAAEELCRAVLEAAPRDPVALHLAAHVQRARGDVAGARELLRRVLEGAPHNLQAMAELGAAELGAGNFQESESWLRRAILLGWNGAAVHTWLGLALSSQDRYAEAVDAFRQAVAVEPRNPGMYLNLAHGLSKIGLREEAISNYDRVLALYPENAEASCSRGDVLLELGRREEALASYERALGIRPDYADALHNRGIVLVDLSRSKEAVDTFRRLLDVAPDYPYVPGYHLHMLLQCCDWTDYERHVAQVIDGIRAGKPVAGPFNIIAVAESPADQLNCSRLFIASQFPAAAQPIWRGERYDHDRIRMAYLSADFRNHAMAYLAAGLFESHDRTRFEITAVAFDAGANDEMRSRLVPAFDRFVDVGNKNDREIASMLRDLEIDIAVDLQGFMKGCRPGIFAQRAAPVQVNYLGYPGTMGAPYMDYIIGDRWVIPEDQQQWYAERVVHLPYSYQVNDSKRAIAQHTLRRAELGLPEQGFVFCCFNNSYKFAPALFDVWMRLLHKVGGSVLWLVEYDRTAARNVRQEAGRRGVDPARLVFAKHAKLEDHLARHRLADLFLDTVPCNAHTTASDALWAGLPVLTLVGNTFAGRVAASLLEAVGLPELVAHSWKEYEGLALKLANDRESLADLRARLARNRATCPLFDTDRYRRHLETAYIGMWERAQRGEPPASFSVSPES